MGNRSRECEIAGSGPERGLVIALRVFAFSSIADLEVAFPFVGGTEELSDRDDGIAFLVGMADDGFGELEGLGAVSAAVMKQEDGSGADGLQVTGEEFAGGLGMPVCTVGPVDQSVTHLPGGVFDPRAVDSVRHSAELNVQAGGFSDGVYASVVAGTESSDGSDPVADVTAITEDPRTGRLWAVGYTAPIFAPDHTPCDLLFANDEPLLTKPTLAAIDWPAWEPGSSAQVQVVALDCHDLALPLSMRMATPSARSWRCRTTTPAICWKSV